MSDYYVEVLVKRNVEKEKKKRNVILSGVILMLVVVGIITMLPVFYYVSVLFVLGYYFIVLKFYVEFEYFYMDSELSISKIYNQSRRKHVLSVSDGMIRLIAPKDSIELQKFPRLKKIDCAANDPMKLPYIMVCEYKGEMSAVEIQMSDELLKELKKNIPYKVK